MGSGLAISFDPGDGDRVVHVADDEADEALGVVPVPVRIASL